MPLIRYGGRFQSLMAGPMYTPRPVMAGTLQVIARAPSGLQPGNQVPVFITVGSVGDRWFPAVCRRCPRRSITSGMVVSCGRSKSGIPF
jgi:hypothetical protein